MSKHTQLKAIFFLFCLSFGNATYSPLAKWVFTTNNLIDGKIKDLSTYNNDPFQRSDGNLLTSSDITCSSLFTSSSGSVGVKGVVSSVTDSTTEFGVSVWINIPYSGVGPYIFQILNSQTYNNFYLHLSWRDIIPIGKLVDGVDNSLDDFPCSFGKWIFVVFYFIYESTWTWNVISPEFSTKVFTDDVPNPGNFIAMTGSADVYYYEIQVFQRAYIDSFVVTLITDDAYDYAATTSSCPCANNYCHSEWGCLSTTACQCPIYCICSANNGICSSCQKDPNLDLSTTCQTCKLHYSLEGSTCVQSSPFNCAKWSSKTVCTQCDRGYFLYDKGTDTSCLSCAKSCSDCEASPNCYECAESVVKDGDSCRTDSIGFQISFSSPNFIVIDLAHPLSKDLTIANLKATTTNGEDIPTTNWDISSLSTLSEIRIYTDITESKLPIAIDFNFNE